VRTADRLGDDGVDDAQAQQVGRGHLHHLGGLGGPAGVAPQDGRAALGRDHRVDRVLEHEHAVAHADGQRAAAAPLARDHRDDRHRQPRHELEVARDGLGLAALLGAHARVGAGRVDEGHHRLAELGGHVHETLGLAIALGVRHAEVPGDLLPGVPPLLVSDEDDRAALEAREAGDDGRVVAEAAVAVHLGELVEEQPAPVARVRPLGVAGELGALPGGQVGVGPLAEAGQAILEPGDLVAGAGRIAFGLQSGDARLELQQRLLEVKGVRHDRSPSRRRREAPRAARPGLW
jgi:hypothetical protein